MRIILNVVLILIVAVLVYMLAGSIREPIAFQEQKQIREEAVVQKLITIRKAQELYRGITGTFSSSFEDLKNVLTNGRFTIVKVIGDPDDPSGQQVSYDTIYKNAADSIKTLGLQLDSLAYVPFGEGAMFNIQADTITYQSTVVSVVEVGVPRKVFMGPYADARFAKYDNSYDPNSIVKFGNMNAPNTSGNWER